MNIHEMKSYLESCGCNLVVQYVPNNPKMLHVDGYHHPNGKGIPDFIYSMRGWCVSSCGAGRVFFTKVL